MVLQHDKLSIVSVCESSVPVKVKKKHYLNMTDVLHLCERNSNQYDIKCVCLCVYVCHWQLLLLKAVWGAGLSFTSHE